VNRTNSRLWSRPFGACSRPTNRCSDCAGQDGAPPGSRTVNTDPLPASLVTVTSPPIMRASLRVMARPSPGSSQQKTQFDLFVGSAPSAVGVPPTATQNG
jgi:hypothetical protein